MYIVIFCYLQFYGTRICCHFFSGTLIVPESIVDLVLLNSMYYVHCTMYSLQTVCVVHTHIVQCRFNIVQCTFFNFIACALSTNSVPISIFFRTSRNRISVMPAQIQCLFQCGSVKKKVFF